MLSLLVILNVGCGKSYFSSIMTEASPSNISEFQKESAEDDDESFENPPIMITGSNLTCKISKQKDDDKIQLVCVLEKDGTILGLEVNYSDLEILDKLGNRIEFDFILNDDLSFTIFVKSRALSSIKFKSSLIEESIIEIIIDESVFMQESIENTVTSIKEEPASKEASDPETPQQVLGQDNSLETPEIFCNSIGTPGSWLLVPGNTEYGTEIFCVMKYEAKNDSGAPTSRASGTPWVSINQQDAKIECASLGEGYHLITNDEWMTIATNIALQGINWNGGTVGTNEMARGHSDNSPANACAADAIDANAYVEKDCTGTSSGTFNQRRTHTLSNGEVIWDLAGNVSEWTNHFNDEEKPTPSTGNWYDYTQSIIGTATMPLTDLIPKVAIDNTWGSAESIGQYFPGNDSSGGGLLRSGKWNDATYAGVFMANLSESVTSTFSNVGFRCAVTVP